LSQSANQNLSWNNGSSLSLPHGTHKAVTLGEKDRSLVPHPSPIDLISEMDPWTDRFLPELDASTVVWRQGDISLKDPTDTYLAKKILIVQTRP
jgi:hypothetical protein